MSRLIRRVVFVTIIAGLLCPIGVASALTFDQPVTPGYIKDNPDRISVVAEKKADGLIHFTITYFAPRPSYLVATTEIRNGSKVVFQSTATCFVREKSATYYAAFAPEQLAGAKFELFAGSFAEADGNPTPVPGGTAYQIQLNEFATSAAEPK